MTQCEELILRVEAATAALEAATAQLQALAFLSAIVRINQSTGALEHKYGGQWYPVVVYDDGGIITQTLSQTPSPP